MDGVLLDGVWKLYGRTAALRGVGLRAEAGETVALLGPNGSGKTTLLRVVAGLTAPTRGRGTVLGRPLHARRESVGMMASDSHLYDDLTAAENLRFVATMAGLKPERARIEGVVREVGLADALDVRVREFSSGMRRRLALGRLILLHPRLWLLDEPYTSLDAAGMDLVDRLIREVNADGGICLVATHDAARIAPLASQSVTLAGGRIVDGERRVQHVG